MQEDTPNEQKETLLINGQLITPEFINSPEFIPFFTQVILEKHARDTLFQALLNAFKKSGGTISATVQGELEKKKEAMHLIIGTLKSNPKVQAAVLQAVGMPQEKNTGDNTELSPTDKQYIYDTAIGLTGIIQEQYIEEVKNALENIGTTPELSRDAKLIWTVVHAALLLEPPPQELEQLAERLKIPPAKLAEISKQIQEEATAPDENFLPGFEPTKEEKIAQAVATIKQQRIVYDQITKRGTSKLDRKAGYMINTLDNEITMPLDIRRADPIEASRDIIRIKWNAPYNAMGEQLRVTPFDQDVETAISNFFDEGHHAVTTEQIYYAMSGQSATTGYPNPTTLKAIEESIEKLNTIPVSIRRVKNGRTSEQTNGQITTEGGEVTIIAEYGTILDTAKSDLVEIQGKRRAAWVSSRRGHLYSAEKMLGRLITTKRETLNLSTSGISFTELSITLRRFCLMEIARFRTTANYTISENKFSLDSMYLYEADPELVEVTQKMERRLKTGTTPTEQAKIRNAKKRRRDLLQKLLQHFKKTGEIIEWDFCQGDKKLPYSVDKNDASKRIYKGTADSVYIQVHKTLKTLGTISTIERRIETSERNRRRANTKDNQE